MKECLHFGAGNIGRGFIAQLLNESNYFINFVDINEKVVNDLKKRNSYNIEILDVEINIIEICNFTGFNINTEKEKIYKKINEVDLITTSIGPNILPIIAKDLANGLKIKVKNNNTKEIDIIACENMIEASSFLKNEIFKYLNEFEIEFIDKYVGFPNSAVDRIVPKQKNKDILLVKVEKFYEWIIEENKVKVNKNLKNVNYVKELIPYIERKLFIVNTGHSALSYVGKFLGYKFVADAIKDEFVKEKLINVLSETGNLLIKKNYFKKKDIENYINKTIKRFENSLVIDELDRICRTPIRKLGYNERFIKPIRELENLNQKNTELISICAYILSINIKNDEQYIILQNMIEKNGIMNTLKEITQLEDDTILKKIIIEYEKLKN